VSAGAAPDEPRDDEPPRRASSSLDGVARAASSAGAVPSDLLVTLLAVAIVLSILEVTARRLAS
jgi:hypothetical protein